MQRIYNRSTPQEQRWIVRIILKGFYAKSIYKALLLIRISEDMNISVKETTVFSVFHPDAQDLYNTCSDLKKVAWELWDPTYRLNAEVTPSVTAYESVTKSRFDRIKLFSFFMHLLPCCASVLLKRLRIQ